jgi:hypothetical protein
LRNIIKEEDGFAFAIIILCFAMKGKEKIVILIKKYQIIFEVINGRFRRFKQTLKPYKNLTMPVFRCVLERQKPPAIMKYGRWNKANIDKKSSNNG